MTTSSPPGLSMREPGRWDGGVPELGGQPGLGSGPGSAPPGLSSEGGLSSALLYPGGPVVAIPRRRDPLANAGDGRLTRPAGPGPVAWAP